MLTFQDLKEAQQHARTHHLRERSVCHVTRSGVGGPELLVFDHVPHNGSGVQVPAGGVEDGETPAQAALRECGEETERQAFGAPNYLGSAAWLHEAHGKRELRHFFHLTAPPGLPDTWDHLAEGHTLFRFHWVPLSRPGLDWDLDLFLPSLTLQELPA